MTYEAAKKIALAHVTPSLGEVRRAKEGNIDLTVVGFLGRCVIVEADNGGKNIRWAENAATWSRRVRNGFYQ